jgi:hypothetical protein
MSLPIKRIYKKSSKFFDDNDLCIHKRYQTKCRNCFNKICIHNNNSNKLLQCEQLGKLLFRKYKHKIINKDKKRKKYIKKMTYFVLFYSKNTILDVHINLLRTYLNVQMFARTFYQRSKFSISFIYVQLYSFIYKNVHYCSFTFIFVQLRSFNL